MPISSEAFKRGHQPQTRLPTFDWACFAFMWKCQVLFGCLLCVFLETDLLPLSRFIFSSAFPTKWIRKEKKSDRIKHISRAFCLFPLINICLKSFIHCGTCTKCNIVQFKNNCSIDEFSWESFFRTHCALLEPNGRSANNCGRGKSDEKNGSALNFSINNKICLFNGK